MTTVYLHVGMPKCASSTIQGYFHTHDKRNAKSGFVYPRAGRSTGGYHNHEPIVRMSPDEIKEFGAKLKAEARNADYVFISCEPFVNSKWDRPVTRHIIQELNETFDSANVRLVFLFRNHFTFVESAFAQFLKGGLYRVNHRKFFRKTAGDIESYCAFFRKTNGFDFFDYAHVIDEFRKYCDDENKVDVFSIEKADLETGDILHELCRKFALVPPPERRVKNARFPGKALLALAYSIERYGFRRTRPFRKDVAEHFASAVDGFAPTLHISGKLAEVVAARQRADAEYFKREFRSEFSALFQPRFETPFLGEPPGGIQLTDEDRAWLDAYFEQRLAQT